jgi:hypothetical protein
MVWEQYLLSILICTLICGIISQILIDTKRKKLVRMLCGIVIAISIFHPLTKVKFKKNMQFLDADWKKADFYISAGEDLAFMEQEKCIKTYCETYILDKAKELDAEITVEIFLNEEKVPCFAEIRYEADSRIQNELQRILETDLGISKENQKWIRNQENSSS